MLKPLLLAALAATTIATTSSKRGLVYVADEKHPTDDNIWIGTNSDITWYYNYGYAPTQAYAHSSLSYVPMLWGATSGDNTSTDFLDAVEALLDAGTNITYVLAFNEPDGQTATGGSDVPADLAASTWKREIEPLKTKHGIKLGAPAVTGADTGFAWLQNFFTECDGGCNPDFIPVHWYGNFEGMASHIGQVMGTYPNVSKVWVTEFALSDADLADTQDFYNQSTEYLDRLENVTHYSYFGSFRSSVSNVGKNVAMLNSKGKLTDIGSWYLGGDETNVTPNDAAGRVVGSAGAKWMALVCGLGVLVASW